MEQCFLCILSVFTFNCKIALYLHSFSLFSKICTCSGVIEQPTPEGLKPRRATYQPTRGLQEAPKVPTRGGEDNRTRRAGVPNHTYQDVSALEDKEGLCGRPLLARTRGSDDSTTRWQSRSIATMQKGTP